MYIYLSVLSTIVSINIHHYREIQAIIQILMKQNHVKIHIIMINKHFNAFFMSTNYCFIMSSACNNVVLDKNFETAVYILKTDVG